VDGVTNYRNQHTGDITGELVLRGHLKSGTWAGEEHADGTWTIFDEDGDRQVLAPVD
jgi:hypothetical protein